MNKLIKRALSIYILCVATSAHASWLADIFNQMVKANSIASNIRDTQNAGLGVQRDILCSQREIQSLMNLVHQSVIGNYGWGDYRFHDYQSYGISGADWTSMMRLAAGASSQGDLGELMRGLSRQFPVSQNIFNRSISDPTTRRYYGIKSQTVLATRAASQLDYNKIQQQIAYQQMLRQQIERTKDLKAAMDLSSRIQIEGNLINLEILRQSALSNQQQAISQQASVTAALANARFLSK